MSFEVVTERSRSMGVECCRSMGFGFWVIAEDIASLFGVQRPAVVKHIGNIYKDEELLQNSTCSILEQVAKDGKTRKVI